MAQYIDKDALVAEIEKLIDEIYAGRPFDSLSREQQVALWYVKSIMSSIDALEVKEMKEEPVSEDLKEEATRLFGDCKVRKGAFYLGAQWQKEKVIRWMNDYFFNNEKYIKDFKQSMEI